MKIAYVIGLFILLSALLAVPAFVSAAGPSGMGLAQATATATGGTCTSSCHGVRTYAVNYRR